MSRALSSGLVRVPHGLPDACPRHCLLRRLGPQHRQSPAGPARGLRPGLRSAPAACHVPTPPPIGQGHLQPVNTASSSSLPCRCLSSGLSLSLPVQAHCPHGPRPRCCQRHPSNTGTGARGSPAPLSSLHTADSRAQRPPSASCPAARWLPSAPHPPRLAHLTASFKTQPKCCLL